VSPRAIRSGDAGILPREHSRRRFPRAIAHLRSVAPRPRQPLCVPMASVPRPLKPVSRKRCLDAAPDFSPVSPSPGVVVTKMRPFNVDESSPLASIRFGMPNQDRMALSVGWGTRPSSQTCVLRSPDLSQSQKLRRMDADDNQAGILVFSSPSAFMAQLAQVAVNTRVSPRS